MTPNEIIDLLSAIAAYDQRTVGQADVEAWLDVAEDHDWTYPQARRVVREFHGRNGDGPRITPAKVTDMLVAKRAEVRRKLFPTDLTPPRELADDPRAEIEWRREYTRTAVERAMDEWARTGDMPEPLPPAPELDLPDHKAELDAAVDRIATGARPT